MSEIVQNCRFQQIVNFYGCFFKTTQCYLALEQENNTLLSDISDTFYLLSTLWLKRNCKRSLKVINWSNLLTWNRDASSLQANSNPIHYTRLGYLVACYFWAPSQSPMTMFPAH